MISISNTFNEGIITMKRKTAYFLTVLFLILSPTAQADIDKDRLVGALISAALETNNEKYNQSINTSKEKIHAAMRHFDTTYDGGNNGQCDKMSNALKVDINRIEKLKSKKEQMRQFESLANDVDRGIDVCNKVSAMEIAKRDKALVEEKARPRVVRGKDIANVPTLDKTKPVKTIKAAQSNNKKSTNNNPTTLSKKISKCAGVFKQVYERSIDNCFNDYKHCSNMNSLNSTYKALVKQAKQLHRLDRKEEQKGYEIAQTISTASMVQAAVYSEGDYAKLVKKCSKYSSTAGKLIKNKIKAKHGNNAIDDF